MLKQNEIESYSEIGKKISESEKFLENHMKAGIELLKTTNPDFDEVFGLSSTVKVYKKKSPQYYKDVQDKIMMYLMRVGGASRSQKSILEDVKKDLPEHGNIAETIFQKPLQTWDKKRIKQLVDGTMQKPISIQGCRNLSKIKKKLLLAEHEKCGARLIKSTVSISKSMLSVGKTSYSITPKKVGRHEYPSIRVPVSGKRVWLRVDALIGFLQGKCE